MIKSAPFFILSVRHGAILILFLSHFLAFSGSKPRGLPPDSIRVFLDSPLLTLDPLNATDATSQRIGNLLHIGLVKRGSNLEVEPDLAFRWTITENRIFRFWIRSDVCFHDGSILGIEDVVYSIGLYPTSRNGSPFSKIKSVKVIGNQILEIETSVPLPYFLNDLYLLKIFKKGSLGKIGAGRFVLESRKDQKIVLKRWNRFYSQDLGSAGVQKIVFEYIRDDTIRYQRLLRGDVDIIPSSLSLSKTAYVEKQKALNPSRWSNIQMVSGPGISLQYLCLNFRNPILANGEVRKAIAYGIDLDTIIKKRYSGFVTRAPSLLSPLIGEFNSYTPSYSFDPDKASQILDREGFPWKNKNSGGWRFHLKFLVSSNKEGRDLARIIVSDLARIGIKVEVNVLELATLLGEFRKGRFDLYTSRWVGIADPSIYFRLFHSTQIHELNRSFYKNKNMDYLLEEAVSTNDKNLRTKDFQKIQEIIATDLPYLTLWHYKNVIIASNKIRGIKLYANGDFLEFANLNKEQ